MIPSTFQLLNHTYKVCIVPDLKETQEILGLCDFDVCTITLQDIGPVSQSTQEHIFYHELTHAILYYAAGMHYRMQGTELYNDEDLVDRIGGLMAQFEATKKYDN